MRALDNVTSAVAEASYTATTLAVRMGDLSDARSARRVVRDLRDALERALTQLDRVDDVLAEVAGRQNTHATAARFMDWEARL